jgi:hypothetical protein
MVIYKICVFGADQKSNMDFLNFDQSEHFMGPGSHVGFPISAKNTNLVYDHPMNISAKFGSNLFCGFRKKDSRWPP